MDVEQRTEQRTSYSKIQDRCSSDMNNHATSQRPISVAVVTSEGENPGNTSVPFGNGLKRSESRPHIPLLVCKYTLRSFDKRVN